MFNPPHSYRSENVLEQIQKVNIFWMNNSDKDDQYHGKPGDVHPQTTNNTTGTGDKT